MKILLVDDDRLILAAMSPGLRDADFEVTTASGGDEAIELCTQAPPDLALLDIRMPGTDGIAVARWLREHTRIPFLFLSASSEAEMMERAVEEGAAGYLVKPVTPARLLEAVQATLKSSNCSLPGKPVDPSRIAG